MFVPAPLLALLALFQATAGPAWPDVKPGRILSAPDWADYNIYPPAARAAEEEGSVTAQLLVDPGGRTVDCRIVRSSGSDALDQGTCERMRDIRFEPGTVGGKPVWSSRSLSIAWQLGDENPLTRSLAVARLRLGDGRIQSCRLTTEGPHFRPFERSGCLPADTSLSALSGSLSEARLEVEIVPAGGSMSAPSGQVLARRLVSFEVNGDGDPVHCWPIVEHGDLRLLGQPRPGRCDDRLRQVWFAAPEEGQHLTGLFEARVVVDR